MGDLSEACFTFTIVQMEDSLNLHVSALNGGNIRHDILLSIRERRLQESL